VIKAIHEAVGAELLAGIQSGEYQVVDRETWSELTALVKAVGRFNGFIEARKAARPAAETSAVRCSCRDFPGADQFCNAHKVNPAHDARAEHCERCLFIHGPNEMCIV
jgi:hypothetical protein